MFSLKLKMGQNPFGGRAPTRPVAILAYSAFPDGLARLRGWGPTKGKESWEGTGKKECIWKEEGMKGKRMSWYDCMISVMLELPTVPITDTS